MSKKLGPAKLKSFVRTNAARYLDNVNVTSVGIGFKRKKGKKTSTISIQFTVGEKFSLESLEAMDTEPLPKFFEIDGVEVPTDIIQRGYDLSAMKVASLEKVDRKKRIDPILPGASIGHPAISAGTLGCVVFDSDTGDEYVLSNWHVLNGEKGKIGDNIVQPGAYDDSRVAKNKAGTLINSHIGLAGDCAIAKIDNRSLLPDIIDLNVPVTALADPELGDKVVKSGRTTAVTYGIVSRIHVTVKIKYDGIGMQKIGCFEYTPDPKYPPANGEVSMGGDSGSAVMLAQAKKSTKTMLGLHFAGETGDAPEHGLACYASSVFKKLNISPTRPISIQTEIATKGFDWNFLSQQVRPPYPVNTKVRNDLLTIGKETVIYYTHFSLVMNKVRKFASWVAWNIDGGNIKKISRKGIPFIKDPDLPDDAQIGEELYSSNPLDRGHIARRADLCWGPLSEARQANIDSFYFTNMTPQHERFNQSGKAGLWGELENAIFDQAKIKDLRVNVMAGPIFNSSDPLYRKIKIPREFWKVISYIDEESDQLKYHGFILSQSDLVANLEGLDFDDFEVYKVPVHRITEKIGFKFSDFARSNAEAIERDNTFKMDSLEMVLMQ